VIQIYPVKDGETLAKKNENQFNLYIKPEIQEMARKQAESVGLKSVSDYISQAIKLDLSELIKKAVEKEKKK